MANLPETATYDAGVYQLETTDPVIGGADGVDNAGARNLANRTAYLKSHVDLMETIVPQVEAEARTATTLRGWTAQRVGQAIASAITALVVQATESVLGIAKIATQAQTNTGTDDETIVTPKKINNGFAILLSSPGYIKLPTWMGNLIIQWGSSAAATTGTTVQLSLTYPTAVLIYFCSAIGTSETPTKFATISTVDTSHIKVWGSAANVTASYLVIGY
jgi:hypothetical protein